MTIPLEGWLYQMANREDWGTADYRVGVWEGKVIVWPAGKITASDGLRPSRGDTVILFFAPSGNRKPGVYGMGVVIDLRNDRLRFRLCRPSDYMKLDPLWTKTTMRTIDQVRGLVKQGTLWRMTPEQLCSIQREIRTYWGFRERAVA